jgi:hypothetical protein
MSHICDSPVWIVPVASVDCGLLGLTSVQSPAKLVVRVILIPAIEGLPKMVLLLIPQNYLHPN